MCFLPSWPLSWAATACTAGACRWWHVTLVLLSNTSSTLLYSRSASWPFDMARKQVATQIRPGGKGRLQLPSCSWVKINETKRDETSRDATRCGEMRRDATRCDEGRHDVMWRSTVRLGREGEIETFAKYLKLKRWRKKPGVEEPKEGLGPGPLCRTEKGRKDGAV